MEMSKVLQSCLKGNKSVKVLWAVRKTLMFVTGGGSCRLCFSQRGQKPNGQVSQRYRMELNPKLVQSTDIKLWRATCFLGPLSQSAVCTSILDDPCGLWDTLRIQNDSTWNEAQREKRLWLSSSTSSYAALCNTLEKFPLFSLFTQTFEIKLYIETE